MTDAVLAIRLRALGDVVLTTPALRALRRGFPVAPLEVVTDPRYAPLVEAQPEVSRVWPLPRDAGATLSLIASLRRRRYALAVDFFGNPRSAQVTMGSGARRSAGFELRGRRHAYQITVPRDHAPAPGRREYAAAAHVRLAVAVGGVEDGLDPRLTLPPRATEAAQRLQAEAGVHTPSRTIGLVAAGTWPTKTWPVSHAAVLARRLAAAGQELLLIAGPGEESVTQRLRHLAPGLAVLPPSDVLGLAGVIARLRAVVGTDSGPRHLAAALGRPTYAWFGPTHPDTWSPPGAAHGFWQTTLPCRACDRTACPHWSCLPGLDPDHATELVLDHLERHARSTADLRPAAHA
jgi:ADP-heptose:LPS heptosyltransferase